MPTGSDTWAEGSAPIIVRKHSSYDKHILIPLALVEQCATRKGALFAYCLLCEQAKRGDDERPSISQMAKQCHIKPDDLRAALRWLCEQGWVNREDRPGGTSIFRV